MSNFRFVLWCVALSLILSPVASAWPSPVGSAFTYQGQLKQGGNPVNATADFQFTLWDAAVGPTQIGATQAVDNVLIGDGLFTATLDFGAGAFSTSARWLEIAVRSPAGGGVFTTLAPRQQLQPAPIAQFALSADGPNLTNLNANNLASGTIADSRLSSNVGVLGTSQTFTGAKTFSVAPSFSAAGAPFSVTNNTMVANLNADLLDGMSSSAFLQGIPNPLTISGTSATHIIRGENASTTNFASGVIGLSTAATGSTYGIDGRSDSTSGSGVHGSASAGTGTTFGGRFESFSTSGRGVSGAAFAATGTTYGVYGQNSSIDGRGVYGNATSTTGNPFGIYGETSAENGTGVYGRATNTGADGNNYGGKFYSDGTFGTAVYAEVTSATGTCWGGRFRSVSPNGIGIEGENTSATGFTIGVSGQSSSTNGSGVEGTATASTGNTRGGSFTTYSSSGIGVSGYAGNGLGSGWGVYGITDTPNGRGVYGLANADSGTNYGGRFESDSTSGRGVFGYATATTGTIYGVHGQASTAAAGFAVYASGDMGASGVKPFRIDHPFDPENKYLLHYATESPVPQNFYSGNVVTDATGYAWVDLPEYFEEINTDFKYQLTVIGRDFAQAIVAEEIAGNRFQIRTSVPGVKVSWRVEANRNDAYVRYKKPKDVVDKEGVERGTYQHPELYGQPPESGMNYDAERSSRHAISNSTPH